ncbi:MAG: hypothetical protein ACRDYA_09340 [Egibacteraceae bacterium]
MRPAVSTAAWKPGLAAARPAAATPAVPSSAVVTAADVPLAARVVERWDCGGEQWAFRTVLPLIAHPGDAESWMGGMLGRSYSVRASSWSTVIRRRAVSPAATADT